VAKASTVTVAGVMALTFANRNTAKEAKKFYNGAYRLREQELRFPVEERVPGSLAGQAYDGRWKGQFWGILIVF
jgi:hypothetical protein